MAVANIARILSIGMHTLLQPEQAGKDGDERGNHLVRSIRSLGSCMGSIMVLLVLQSPTSCPFHNQPPKPHHQLQECHAQALLDGKGDSSD